MFLGGEDLGIHCSIIHMNLACHFAGDTLTSFEIRESQSVASIIALALSKSAWAYLQMSLHGFPGFLS